MGYFRPKLVQLARNRHPRSLVHDSVHPAGGHRDTQAIHAKLDELLKAQPNASEKLARIDEKEPEEIETYRDGKKAAKDKAVTPKSSRGGP